MTVNNINFWSGKNYLKRDSSTGSGNLAAPATVKYSEKITTLVITHNLGIIPFFRLYYEPFGNGIVWESMGTRSQAGAENPSSPGNFGDYLMGWADTTTLTIEIGNSATTSGTVPVYWIIYKDFGLL